MKVIVWLIIGALFTGCVLFAAGCAEIHLGKWGGDW